MKCQLILEHQETALLAEYNDPEGVSFQIQIPTTNEKEFRIGAALLEHSLKFLLGEEKAAKVIQDLKTKIDGLTFRN